MTDELRVHELSYAEIGRLVRDLKTEVVELRSRVVGLTSELERVQRELARKYE